MGISLHTQFSLAAGAMLWQVQRRPVSHLVEAHNLGCSWF